MPRAHDCAMRGVVVAVTSHRRCRGVRVAELRRDAARLMRALGCDAELSVALVGDSEMRDLNAHYRRQHRSTDVLSFAAGDPPPEGVPALLGDVVISVDTALRQARARGVPVAQEVRLLLTHGVLHLLGYDHEGSPAEARRMYAKQRKLTAMLGRRPRSAKRRRRVQG